MTREYDLSSTDDEQPLWSWLLAAALVIGIPFLTLVVLVAAAPDRPLREPTPPLVQVVQR
jgi:hypothetical protein